MRGANGPWPAPVYEIRIELPAPLDSAYRWCTDYRSDDGRRAGEGYERRVLRRTRRTVLFEDTWWERDGWRWRRTEVELHPPDRWVAHSTGNVRDARITYRLHELPSGHTQLELRMLRRPSVWHPEQPRKAAFESYLRSMWGSLARALASERAKRPTSARRSVRRAPAHR